MLPLLFARFSGWLLVLLIATTISLPFLLRSGRLRGAARQPFRRRLRPHYWLGYVIAALTLAHAAVALSGGRAGRVDTTGLYLANAALLAVVAQVFLGLVLREASARRVPVVRRWHLWGMVGIVAFALGHILLNSPLVR